MQKKNLKFYLYRCIKNIDSFFLIQTLFYCHNKLVVKKQCF